MSDRVELPPIKGQEARVVRTITPADVPRYAYQWRCATDDCWGSKPILAPTQAEAERGAIEHVAISGHSVVIEIRPVPGHTHPPASRCCQ